MSLKEPLRAPIMKKPTGEGLRDVVWDALDLDES